MNIISVFGKELPQDYQFTDYNVVLGGSLEECLAYMQTVLGDARSEFALDEGFVALDSGQTVYKLIGVNIKKD